MKKHPQEKVYNYSKLIGRTAELGLNQASVALASGMTPATYGLKLKSKSEFTQREIMAIMDLLNIPMNEVEVYFFAT